MGPANRTRSLALTRITLADIHIRRGDLDAAVKVGHDLPAVRAASACSVKDRTWIGARTRCGPGSAFTLTGCSAVGR